VFENLPEQLGGIKDETTFVDATMLRHYEEIRAGSTGANL
jgi:hypothetical protein